MKAAEKLLIEQIRAVDQPAWEQLIGRYEGRLMAFVESKLRNPSISEDVIQETFVGCLTSLPNHILIRYHMNTRRRINLY